MMADCKCLYNRLIDEKEKGIFLLLIRAGLKIFSLVYYHLIQLRLLLFKLKILQVKKLNAYVISVGNITLGGTGKTPFVLWLANILKEKGKKVAVLSRGYKGSFRKKIGIVSDGCHILMKAKECGDEPLLLARNLPLGVPVIVGKNRFLSGKYAIDKFGVDTLILDDGFQHLKLFRDLDIVLINSKDPIGNGKVFPQGILREPLASLRRGNILIFTKCDKEINKSILQRIFRVWGKDKLICKSIHKPVSFISLHSKKEFALNMINDRRILALSSIGDPLTFENMLEELGAKKILVTRYPDHYDYKTKDVEKIVADFENKQTDMIITTEKDAIRLENIWREGVDLYYLKIEMKVSDEYPFFNLSG
ncbi:MAG: tetraacyldisaccharide 4'-kinase [bacterium]|nr:tetraacyldisaccharide 4'-kinase [bacterium]